jgi:hypothetical protein
MDIQDIAIEDELITITALVEDKVLLRLSDSVNPAEYGPAICTAVIDITDIPEWINSSLLSKEDQIKILENFSVFDKLDWEIIENKTDDFNDVY